MLNPTPVLGLGWSGVEQVGAADDNPLDPGARDRHVQPVGLEVERSLLRGVARIAGGERDEDDITLSLVRELWEGDIPILSVSAQTGQDTDTLREEIFRALNIIRVYSKAPGKQVSKEAPYTVKEGSTLLDFAAVVHKDFSSKLKHARVWGSSAFDGQSVASDFVLEDGDIVELHI